MVAWSRVYRIYYNKSRRLSLSSSRRKARYLSYIQNSYALVHSIGTPSITPCSVIPPSCLALSAAPVVVVIGSAGSVPIGRGDPYGTVRSVRGLVGVVVRFGVWSLGSEFWVRVLGRSLVRVRGGYTLGTLYFFGRVDCVPFFCWDYLLLVPFDPSRCS